MDEKNYQYCTGVRTYLVHLPDTRVPTDVRKHLLLYLLPFLLMRVRTHRTYCFNGKSKHLLVLHKSVVPTIRTYWCAYG